MDTKQWVVNHQTDSSGQPWSGMCRNPEGFGPFSVYRVPDFTPCFEDTVITFIPYVFVIFTGMIRLWILSKREPLSSDMTRNWLYFAKMTTLLLLLFTAISAFTLSILDVGIEWINDAQILSQALTILVLIFVTGLHHIEYTRNRVSSATLLFFWLFVLAADGVKLRTRIMNHDYDTNAIQFALFSLSYALSLVIFALENKDRPKSQYIMLEEDEHDSPEEKTNIFGRLTFSWMTPLMRLGYQKPLAMDDLWNLKSDDQSAIVGAKFQENWRKEMSKAKPSLLRALVKTLGGPFFLAALFKALQDILQFTQPLLLKILMKWVTSYNSDEPQPAYRGVFIAVAMFFTAICQTMFLHQYFQRCFMTGMRLRAALVTSIYQKTLVLSNASRQKSTVGEIVNHMSVDAQRLMDLCTYFHIVWSGPLQIILALFFLYNTMGPSIGAGVGILILAIPLNTYIARKMRGYQKTQMGNKDSRVKLMNEILNGIRVIKLYAWESPFLEKISYIRNELELATLKKIGVLSAVQNFTWTSIPFLVSLTTFAVYVTISDHPLTSDIAFVAIALFGLLQFPLTVFPNVITSTIEASVSLYRIENYLSSEEIDVNSVTRSDYRNDPTFTEETPLVEVNNAKVKWSLEDPKPVLSNINLKVKKGEVTAIVGRVGSGKSSLISALLGDTVKLEGDVILRGSVAYVPQQPWVMNASLRDNIVFGHRWDPHFYDRVLEACSLKSDIAILNGGDQTEIGERGINLSGGQKARVSLARAIYARADIYLLDDPLSAVDAHVGRHIFDNVIGPEGILKNKARVLVTHGISYLPRINHVVMLRDGEIALSGTYSDLMSQKSELYALINDFGNQSNNKAPSEDEITVDDEDVLQSDTASIELVPREEDATLHRRRQRMNSDASIMSAKTLRRASLVSLNKKGKAQNGGNDRLITVEESAKGSVTWDVYKEYAKSCSFYGVIVVLLLLVLAQLASVGTNLWLKYWSSHNQNEGTNDGIWFYLSIYALIGWSSTLFAMVQTLVLWVFCAIRSARVLHSEMLETIMRSPMSFFDTTPLGRILNRFSKDQHTVDEVLPRTFNGYFRVLFSVISTIAIIAFSTPLFMILVIPLGCIYIYVQRYYLTTSRELKRLDSVGKSPIYSHFQETISGVSTIRAYEQQNRFMFENEGKLDDNQRAYFPSISCNRWLAVRLEFLGSIIILAAALFAVLGVVYGSSRIDAGLVGLSVSYALNVTQALNWVIRSYCEIETNVVSVERIKEYIDLPTEKYNAVRGVSPMWPEKGLIEFRDYATRYRPGLDLALRDLSFTVAPKEKIGIIGRTGAGKSSLSLSLFRIVEAAKGSIFIDGVDISSLRLFDLRSRLTIIPQDPVLFAGTVRDNLDPFGTHDDAELWQALHHSHLGEYITKLDNKLNAIVLEGGENFSVGQRQLICLARALLRKTTILVLDEATAAIDVETDSIIQETIRSQFAHCTILTIAHRINTVLDSDRILVLDKGSIAEFESPTKLLEDKQSIFYSMAKEAGLTE
ncbi:multi drug resistance-associated protein MRP [Mucor mucedo]|uniref:multi drug resistance-associated protein MRP n=1 Tax=Mucor mucedo TaxID=29922 RepID=UPI00221FA17C|nr:multi drug resistance-associated protein MRP [Mucor mucedo]KAI7889943.1 multi drug resistance-associated protein MRP [Mucor mucedo]